MSEQLLPPQTNVNLICSVLRLEHDFVAGPEQINGNSDGYVKLTY